MTDINPVQNTVTVTVVNHAGGVAPMEVTVDEGTAVSAILEKAGITVTDGQTVNFKAAKVSQDTAVEQDGMLSVSANAKAA